MTIGLNLGPAQRVYAAFFLHALTMAAVYPRLPAIMERMGIGEGALGLALIGVPVGTLISLTFGTPLIERLGFRRALLTIPNFVAIAYAIAVQATTPLGLFLLLIPVGLGIGAVEMMVNLEADRVEAQLGRRIMNRAHSFWSLGFFSAGLLGAGMAYLHVTPQVHLMLIVPITAVMVALFLGKFQPAPLRQTTATAAPKFASPTMPIMLLVLVALSAVLMEGAGMDWSAIYMKSVWDSSGFVAGLAVATVAASQACFRFFADGFVEKYSPVRVARMLMLVLGVGVFLAFAEIAPILSMLGFGLIGVGTSAIFPLAMSAAAQFTDRPAAINVAAFAQTAFVAFLFGPPLLGFVAEHWGIRWTFGLGMPFVILSFIFAGALDPRHRQTVANPAE